MPTAKRKQIFEGKGQMRMRKVVCALLAAACFCVTSVAGAATGQFLNGDSNYPMTYGHANWWEYLDLSSCTIVADTDDYYELAACYIREIAGREERYSYHTRYFRKEKKEGSLPKYRGEGEEKWTTIPAQEKALVSEFIERYGYFPYFKRFHPAAYYMFKDVYRQVWGVDYID